MPLLSPQSARPSPSPLRPPRRRPRRSQGCRSRPPRTRKTRTRQRGSVKIRAPFSVVQVANGYWLIRDAAGRKVQTIRPRDRWGEISLIGPEWRDITKMFVHAETTKVNRSGNSPTQGEGKDAARPQRARTTPRLPAFGK